jgi:hypothetical protein
MNTKHKIKAENSNMIGNWDKQSKQLKEEFPGPTHEDLVFETGKEHDLFKRVGDRPEYLHEEVIKIITKDQPGNG